MVDFALTRDRCIGMIQTTSNNLIYNVGCVGKINSFSETNDGRYLISLQGTNCFKVDKELEKTFNFRIVEAKLLNNLNSTNILLSKKQKINLLSKYEKYIAVKNINLNLEELKEIDVSQLIKFIAMISPFKNEDKQVLLEAESLLEFYDKLVSIIEIEILGDYSNNTIN